MGQADDMARVGVPQARQVTIPCSVSPAIERRCRVPMHPNGLERAALAAVRGSPWHESRRQKGVAQSRCRRPLSDTDSEPRASASRLIADYDLGASGHP